MSASYDYYRIFYYVARYKSFNKAAKVLMNSQPNIARAINNLESELGCVLFSRSNKGVELTEHGEALFEHVEPAYKEIEIGENAVRNLNKEKTETVRIGMSNGIPDAVHHSKIVPSLARFSHENPDIHLKIKNETTPQLIKEINENELDIAVITTSPFSSLELRKKILFSFREMVIAGNEYRKDLEGRSVSLKELNEYPIIILGKDTETYEFHDQIFAMYGQILRPYIETHTMLQALIFAENNMGIACIAEESADDAIKRGTVFAVDMSDPMPEREAALISSARLRTRASALLEKYILGER